jgi:hypothetical protein
MPAIDASRRRRYSTKSRIADTQTLTAIDVATGANPEGVMARAVVWATTLAACAFILFVIYGDVGS